MPPRARSRMVVAWMPVSQRSTTLARRLDAELVLLSAAKGFRRPWTAWARYPALVIRSWAALATRRPRGVVVIAPPVVAPLVVLPLARLLGARVAVDIHSGALLDRRWQWSIPLLRILARMADAAVVTLPSLADRLDAPRRAIVVPDPLPDMPADAGPATPRDVPDVVAICGWGDDEPIAALVDAARSARWRLTLTGRPRWTVAAPENVRIAGFLPDHDYVRLLRDADAIIVLTTREETLLSGAWEAVALAKPLVLSDTDSLRQTFGADVACVDATPQGIRAAIDRLLADPGAHERAVRLRERFATENDRALERLDRAIDGSGTDDRGTGSSVSPGHA